MNVSEAASRLLELLEQEDQEEYSYNHAVLDVNQALFEMAEENEFRFLNRLTNYTLETPASGEEEDFWSDVPGRALITDVLSVTWGGFSYIKRGWIDVSGETYPFRERDFSELMDTFGDSEGTPEAWAVDGEYFYWRPIAAAGTDHTIRMHWQAMPGDAAESSEPIMLAQCPYAVLYKAAMSASIWLLDDNRVPMFKGLSDAAYERYNARAAMTGDGPRAMEEFNG